MSFGLFLGSCRNWTFHVRMASFGRNVDELQRNCQDFVMVVRPLVRWQTIIDNLAARIQHLTTSCPISMAISTPLHLSELVALPDIMDDLPCMGCPVLSLCSQLANGKHLLPSGQEHHHTPPVCFALHVFCKFLAKLMILLGQQIGRDKFWQSVLHEELSACRRVSAFLLPMLMNFPGKRSLSSDRKTPFLATIHQTAKTKQAER